MHNSLKHMEGEGYKARELSASKEWFDNFRKRLAFENVNLTGEAASANQETAGEFQDSIKKIIEEKGYLNRFVMHKKALYFGGK